MATVIAIKIFDWTTKRVLCHTKRNGQDRIEWLEMSEVYVNPMDVSHYE